MVCSYAKSRPRFSQSTGSGREKKEGRKEARKEGRKERRKEGRKRKRGEERGREEEGFDKYFVIWEYILI
jgi:hypothetical protein